MKYLHGESNQSESMAKEKIDFHPIKVDNVIQSESSI